MNLTGWSRLLVCAGVFLLAGLPASRATSVIAPTFSELVDRAETVIHGTVTSTRSDWAEQAGFRVIKSWVSIQLEEPLKGSPGTSTITLEFLGGRVGQSDMNVQGSPRFVAGDEIVVFIQGNGRDACPLVGWGHGAYRVAVPSTGGEKQIVRMNGLPLQSPADVQLPLTTLSSRHPAYQSLASVPGMSLSAFKTAIRQKRDESLHVQ
ncbi:MAG: hypothetical protein U1F61_25515 [Opitutaceae bacterium]